MKKLALIVGCSMAPMSACQNGVDDSWRGPFERTSVVYPVDANEGMMFGGSVALSSQLAVVAGMHANIEHPAKRDIKNAGEVYLYTLQNDFWVPGQTLQASDARTNDNFGFSVDTDNNTVLVGSWRADVGDVFDAGAAYVFEKQADGKWTETQRLVAPNPTESADFGASVAISGNTLVVGAQSQKAAGVENAGAAYVFQKLDGEEWVLTQTLVDETPEDGELFGRSVAVGDGEIFVSSPRSTVNGKSRVGAVHIFGGNNAPSDLSLLQSISPDNGAVADLFGEHIAYSNGSIAVGAWHDDSKGVNAGAVYVFDRREQGWTQSAKLVASDGSDDDRLGFRVDIWGDIVLAGAHKTDGYFSTSETGAAFLFQRDDDGWQEVTKFLPDNDEGGHFGRAVALSESNVLVGAELTGPGKAYFFKIR